jgi:hypothetical protein
MSVNLKDCCAIWWLVQVNVNLAGLPALVVPCGFVEGGSAGLPVGLQMIGSPFSEVIQAYCCCWTWMLLHRSRISAVSLFYRCSSIKRTNWWFIFFNLGEFAESRPHLRTNTAGCQFRSTNVGRSLAAMLRWYSLCWFWASLELLLQVMCSIAAVLIYVQCVCWGY